VISGSGGRQGSGAGNDGAWWVDSVDSETQLTVRPLNGEAVLNVGIGAAGTVSVRQGGHRLHVLDQAGPLDFGDIAANTVFATQQAPGTSDFGSGTLADFVLAESISEGNRTHICTLGITEIYLESESTAINLTSENEILLGRNYGVVGANASQLLTDGGALVGSATIQIGSDNSGGDRYSASDGDAVIGYADITSATKEWRGTYWDAGDTASNVVQETKVADFYSCIIRPNQQSLAVSDIENETVIIYGPKNSLYSLTNGIACRNISIAQQDALSYLVVLGSPITIPIEGVLASDNNYYGMWGAFNGAIQVLNPRDDYDINFICGQMFSGGSATKEYTFDPRFVTRNDAGTAYPQGVPGLTVSWWTVVELTGGEIYGGTAVTNASGRLSGIETDRDGINAARQYKDTTWTSGLDLAFRVTVEGSNSTTGQPYRPINEIRQFTRYYQADYPVDLLQTDYEGEMYT
jgi:hypothetical protein